MESLAIDVPATIVDRYQKIRAQSLHLVSSLSEADAQIQSMPDASPAKWHLAHTTWFFETFILCPYLKDYARFNETYNYLYNSYYNGIGEQYPRAQRGLISRPSLDEILSYRAFVDDSIQSLFDNFDDSDELSTTELSGLLVLGLNHEQQHQELLLTDIKHAFFHNPLYPSFNHLATDFVGTEATKLNWLPVSSGLASVGHSGEQFSFDNERPAHKVYIHDFSIASRLVTNGEYAKFIASGGYQNPNFWLADGWAWLQQQYAQKKKPQPLYWVEQQNRWFEFTLFGLLPLNNHQAVTHVNYYEASAYANWLGVRLPTEFEWEVAAKQMHVKPRAASNMSDIKLHPSIASTIKITDDEKSSADFLQAFDNVWQWTTSGYGAYPGFSPFNGVAGEYNGKFMSNQNILRGSSCVTPVGHTRETYRNFFYAHQQWQFTGIRLVKGR
jgi:ergothioneine biosynthesis protein EgtB